MTFPGWPLVSAAVTAWRSRGTRGAPAGAGDDTPRSELGFALLGALAFLLVVGFATAHHEMWRDEIQAWLIARDSTSLAGLLDTIRYEGHPPAWYLLLWAASRLTAAVVAMQVVNIAAATGAAFLVLRHAPGPRALRLAAVFGYFLAYEYGVIARSNGLAAALLAAVCAAFGARRTRPLLVGGLLAVAASTVVQATILAFALALVLLAEVLLRPPERARGRTWGGLAIAFAGIALVAQQLSPPADSGYHASWNLSLDAGLARRVLAGVAHAYLPLPVPGPRFWQTQLLALLPGWTAAAWAVGLVVLATAALALATRPLALAYFMSAATGLLLFSYTRVPGALRHHGFHVLALGSAAWLAGHLPRRTAGALTSRLARTARAIRLAAAGVLALQVGAAAIALGGEIVYVFSGARGTAALIRREGLDRWPLVGERDYTVSAVVGHLGARSAYYASGNRWGAAVRWDEARLAPYTLWPEVDGIASQARSPVTVVLDYAALMMIPPPASSLARMRGVGCVEGQVERDESFCVFVLWPPGSAPPGVASEAATGAR